MDTALTVNSLLGHPGDARLLILNVDDFGMCHAMNEAALRMFREGVATSTTLIPAFEISGARRERPFAQ